MLDFHVDSLMDNRRIDLTKKQGSPLQDTYY